MIDGTPLAQAHFGDWIETIIVLAIVLGSVFQGLGKAIIKKLTEMKDADALERRSPTDPQPGSHERRPPAARPRPDRPTAGPSPSRPETSQRHPPSPMLAPRPIAGPAFGTPSAPPPTAAPSDAPRPVAKPVVSRAKTHRTRRASAEDLRRRKPQDTPAPASAPKHRFKKMHESVAEHHLQLSDEVAHPSTAAAYHEPQQVRTRLPKLTRSVVRDAIILREILGPPVALRDPSDSF